MINFAEFKKFFIFSLIGSLIIAALVAVVTVLTGEFNEVSVRVLFTLLMVIIHSLVSLTFIWDDEHQNTFERLSFFINVMFITIVLSFFTSIFGIWEILEAELVWDLYQTYGVLAFAALHADILSKALNKEGYLDKIIYVNYLFMTAVVVMLLPVIYTLESHLILGEFYFRVLGALGIIDGTLSVLTIIFYKLYMHKHPKVENALGAAPLKQGDKPQRRGLSIWVWILIIYLLMQVISPVFYFMQYWFN